MRELDEIMAKTQPSRPGAKASAHEVWVMGLGAVSPAGQDVAEFWQSLFESPAPPCRDAITGLPGDQSLRHAYALPVSARTESAQHQGLSRFESLAAHAIEQACSDAGLHAGSCQADGEFSAIGLAIGTAAGDTALSEAQRCAGQLPQFAQCNPYRVVDRLAACLPLPLNGPVYSVSNACAAALYAISQAVDLIADGTADAMVVVGVEVLSRVTQAGFDRMTALDPDRCRPFDADRNGTVLGEGAAALLLTSSEFREKHCAPRSPYGRLTAGGSSCDAHHPTAPQPQGRDIRVAVRRALQAAGIGRHQIGLVLPHGTGTPMNDKIEGDMLAELFGEHVADLHLMPIKSHLGHCAGASGAFSVVAAAQALASGCVPPWLHTNRLDPALPLRMSHQTEPLRHDQAQHALINAYGFGGNNLSLVLEAVSHA